MFLINYRSVEIWIVPNPAWTDTHKHCRLWCVGVCLQIVTNIYEPQGIAFVDVRANFLSNDLLPLVDKTVTANKVHSLAFYNDVSSLDNEEWA